MSTTDKKIELENELAAAKAKASRLERDLEKLDNADKVGALFAQEPGPGSVLRFSRKLVGSKNKYTFVAFRSGVHVNSWHVTGSRNTLSRLGLPKGGNTWETLLVAMDGDTGVKVATSWSAPNRDEGWVYYETPGGVFYRYGSGRVETFRKVHNRWVESRIFSIEQIESRCRRVSSEYVQEKLGFSS